MMAYGMGIAEWTSAPNARSMDVYTGPPPMPPAAASMELNAMRTADITSPFKSIPGRSWIHDGMHKGCGGTHRPAVFRAHFASLITLLTCSSSESPGTAFMRRIFLPGPWQACSGCSAPFLTPNAS